VDVETCWRDWGVGLGAWWVEGSVGFAVELGPWLVEAYYQWRTDA
jgi:hypothetical protein